LCPVPYKRAETLWSKQAYTKERNLSTPQGHKILPDPPQKSTEAHKYPQGPWHSLPGIL